MHDNYPTRLTDGLHAAGMATEFCKSPDGGGILILPYGARVLGLYSPCSCDNFLWHNPALDERRSANDFFQSEKWHNSGGHRTWLAPEVSFFYPNYPDWSCYSPPRQLDPSNYQMTDRGMGGVQFVNHFSVRSFVTHREIEAKITKTLSPALNPLRETNETADAFDCEYAGYQLTTQLEILDETELMERVGLWDLLQVPYGGEVFIRTSQRAVPRHYFGEMTPGDLHVDDHLVRYKAHTKGILKFGINPAVAAGRAGYLYQAGDCWNLIIRNFCVDPSGDYIDVPCNDLHASGDAVQVCCVNNHMGAFTELEYHVPAIGYQTGLSECTDVCQTWAFRGKTKEIQQIRDLLLTADTMGKSQLNDLVPFLPAY